MVYVRRAAAPGASRCNCKGDLKSRHRFSLNSAGEDVIVGIVDIQNRSADDACLCLRVDVNW